MSLNNEKRDRAYKVGGKVTRERIEKEAPLDGEALRLVEASDILVVKGQYDRVEKVLEALELPFTAIEPGQFGQVPLDPKLVLVINCPGELGRESVSRIRRFVEVGGTLFTTDWALKHVLEVAFPGIVEFNQRATQDEVVRIEIKSKDNRFLAGVLDAGDDPLWWLEGSSYPIRVLDPEKVEVLITSRELKDRYGESAVAVRFRFGEGEVFHMISHYYLQRTELREVRHKQGAEKYVSSKGVSAQMFCESDLKDLNVGDVESAASSAKFFANIIASKKRSTLGGEDDDGKAK